MALLLAGTVLPAQQDSLLIARAQRVSVRALDSSLIAVPFSRWIATLRPLPPSHIHWEVNDCGEGGDGRTAPTCVEAILDLAPDTTAHASVIVAGLDGKPTPPAVFSVVVVAGKSVRNFRTLAQWAEFVRHRRE